MAYGGLEVQIHVFLTTALVGGWWYLYASANLPLTPVRYEAE
jgi:hypothetical protein